MTHNPNAKPSFILISKAPVEYLKEGMILAEDVFVEKRPKDQKPLINQGTALTNEHVRLLNKYQFTDVLIEPQANITPPTPRANNSQLTPDNTTGVKARAYAPPNKRHFSGCRILIIDNITQVRHILTEVMRRLGSKHIDAFADAAPALDRMESTNYQVVVTSHYLGDNKKTGTDIFEEAKSRHLIGMSTVFVILTGEDINQVKQCLLLEETPDEYITKPFTPDVLQRCLQKILEQKSYLVVIDEALKSQNYEKAIWLCDQQIKIDQKNMFSLMRIKSNIFIITRQYGKAKALFEKVLNIRSNILWAKFGLGKTLFLEKKYTSASEIFKNLIMHHSRYLPAYDWLANTLERIGELAEAQETQMKAVKLTPTISARHNRLGALAYLNNDFDVAEKALIAALKIGKDKGIKDANAYLALAKTYTKTQNFDNAMGICKDLKKLFKTEQQIQFEAHLIEGTCYKETGKEDNAERQFDIAQKILDGIGKNASVETVMVMAKAHFLIGDKQKGMTLMKDVIADFCDDAPVLEDVQNMFYDIGQGKKGEHIIHEMKTTLARLNDEGTRLFEGGKLQDALTHYAQAVKQLPKSKTLNRNHAIALIVFMQQNGKDERMLYQCKSIIDFLRHSGTPKIKYQKLQILYSKLLES